jgi:Cu(I)/Ag(I) efflux system membrane fusion protein
MTEDDIAALEESRTPSAMVPARATADGTVIVKNAYEGQYVAAEDALFETADYSRMWFLFDAYEQDLPWLQPGQLVEITSASFAGEKMVEAIELVEPYFNMITRTAKVRVPVTEPHFLAGDVHVYVSHHVLAQGRVQLDAPQVLTVPRSAILNGGTGPVVYVDVGMNAYEQRKPVLGRFGDTHVEVIIGLEPGQRVVTRGALLVDAQAQLSREAEGHAMP